MKKAKRIHKRRRKKKMMRSGLAAVISVVLLIVVAVVIVGYAFGFFSGIMGGGQDKTSAEIERQMTEIKSTFSLEKQDSTKILIKNTGTSDIEDGSLLVYLNNKEVYAFIPLNITPGSVGEMIVSDILDISGPAGTKAELVVPGKAITRKMTVEKPEEIVGTDITS